MGNDTTTASLIRYNFLVISKTLYAYFEVFSLKKKCLKTYFLLVCEVCTNYFRTPCILQKISIWKKEVIIEKYPMSVTVPPRLCPYMIVPTRLWPHDCDHMTVPTHVCALTRLCPDTFVPTHVCAQAHLCRHTFVPTHDSAHTRLCPHTFVPTHICAQTCLCQHMFVAKHISTPTRIVARHEHVLGR